MDEGVVKYSIEHSSTATAPFVQYDAIENVRSHLVALGLIGERAGVGYGNLSVRDTTASGFFITATQTGALPSLQKEHYSYVHRCDFDSFTAYSQGVHQPSSEALSHAMIYAVHPDISAVIHIHSRALWEYMIDHRYPATTAAYGTKAMVSDIAALYTDRDPFLQNAFVMQGHHEGIMTFGKSLQEAQLRLYDILKYYLFQASHHTHKVSVQH